MEEVLITELKKEPRKLPRTAHMSVIGETIVREAPFAAKCREAWKEAVATPEFQSMTEAGFWWFTTHVLDKGETVEQPPEDEHFSTMAENYVSLFRKLDRKLVEHVHEALAQSILLVMAAADPRCHDDKALRRQVLDRCAEWATGMRPARVPPEHWLLQGGRAPQSTPRDTLVRTTYTLQHSPFFRHFFAQRHVTPNSTKVRLGLTVGLSRVPHLVHHHVPESEKHIVQRAVKRIVRAAPKPMPVTYVLSNSGVTRRSAMDDHARQRAELKQAARAATRERRKIAARVDDDQRAVLQSDNLREYATKLVKATHKVRYRGR